MTDTCRRNIPRQYKTRRNCRPFDSLSKFVTDFTVAGIGHDKSCIGVRMDSENKVYIVRSPAVATPVNLFYEAVHKVGCN